MELQSAITFNTQDFLDEKITLTAILGCFERIATAQLKNTTLSFPALKQLGKTWVILQNHYEFCQKALPNGNYVLSTVAHLPNERTCNRDYVLFCNGKKVLTGFSKWCLIDLNTRRLASFDGVVFPSSCALPDHKNAKVKPFETNLKMGEYVVRQEDMDFNGHMNNVAYGNLVTLAMGKKAFQSATLNYVKECKQNDVLTLFCEGNQMKATKEGQVCFVCEAK